MLGKFYKAINNRGKVIYSWFRRFGSTEGAVDKYLNPEWMFFMTAWVNKNWCPNFFNKTSEFTQIKPNSLFIMGVKGIAGDLESILQYP